MTVVYNEIADYPAAWLRNLVGNSLLPQGEVWATDIRDISPNALADVIQFHTFAGIGIWAYALALAGWPPTMPVWTGSCPCQPFSSAGKGLGEKDVRHLWPSWRYLISECKPPVIFGEQVASPAGRNWFSSVRADLEEMGYEVGASDLCAAGVGAPHIRQRLFFGATLAHTKKLQRYGSLHNSESIQQKKHEQPQFGDSCNSENGERSYWEVRKPPALVVVNRDSTHVERLRAYGNAIVPQVAARFITAFVAANNEISK